MNGLWLWGFEALGGLGPAKSELGQNQNQQSGSLLRAINCIISYTSSNLRRFSRSDSLRTRSPPPPASLSWVYLFKKKHSIWLKNGGEAGVGVGQLFS